MCRCWSSGDSFWSSSKEKIVRKSNVVVRSIDTAYFNKLNSVKEEVLSTFPTREDEIAYIEHIVQDVLPHVYRYRLEDKRTDPKITHLYIHESTLSVGKVHPKIAWEHMLPIIVDRLRLIGIKSHITTDGYTTRKFLKIKISELEKTPNNTSSSQQGPYR